LAPSTTFFATKYNQDLVFRVSRVTNMNSIRLANDGKATTFFLDALSTTRAFSLLYRE
jgi:NADPH-dependent 7-cyano-7-deazaguanine reductase QueF-like protein